MCSGCGCIGSSVALGFTGSEAEADFVAAPATGSAPEVPCSMPAILGPAPGCWAIPILAPPRAPRRAVALIAWGGCCTLLQRSWGSTAPPSSLHGAFMPASVVATANGSPAASTLQAWRLFPVRRGHATAAALVASGGPLRSGVHGGVATAAATGHPLPAQRGEAAAGQASGNGAVGLDFAAGALALAATASVARRTRFRREAASRLAPSFSAPGVLRRAKASATEEDASAKAGNFVEDIVAADLERGTHGGVVRTRFPPEPNGYLHIGHAKSICLNFGIASKFAGTCNLRFDDTNPASEKQEYIDAIKRDVSWLGFQWDGPEHYASDYFGQLHEWAVAFIERGWAYVDELTAEEIQQYRGSLTRPGKDSPYRGRPIAENLALFARMRDGEIEQGKAVLRAKIDMSHGNVQMRDPIMYRIVKEPPHPRTGDHWPIYPSYDWAHGLSDALEEVTHSVCTLEFNMHNELYDWFNQQVKSLGTLPCPVLPRQYEFARLEMTHIVVSKRKLKRLVDDGHVDGWDDPRMPTLSGMRRRGYPPAALRKMCELIGVTKVPTSVIEYNLLEACVRDALQQEAKVKLLCVLRPLRVVVTNWEGEDQEIVVPPQPGQVDEDSEEATVPERRLYFGRELAIDQEDFMEEPPAGFKRLAPGRTVKLRYGYTITCEEVVPGENGTVAELRCTYDPESLGKRPPKKVAVVHWAHATRSVPVQARLYDRLFAEPRPEDGDGDFMEALNPNSLEVLDGALCEPCVRDCCTAASAVSGEGPMLSQFERCGYFALDGPASEANGATGGPLVFNRTVTLNESWKPAGRAGQPDPRRKKGGK